jgi:hypothetical protein
VTLAGASLEVAAETTQAWEMTNRKDRLTKSLSDMSEKAEDCSELAKAERGNADEQHETSQVLHERARRMEKLGHGLEADVANLKRELDMPPSAPKPSNVRHLPKPTSGGSGHRRG